MIAYRLLAVATAFAAFATALPRQLQLGPRQATAGNACNVDADCGFDAPLCDFAWLEKPAPYNSPQKICMLLPWSSPCTADSQCATGLCDDHETGDPNRKTCNLNQATYQCVHDIDCTSYTVCGTSANVLA
ncbi:hypothetical protein OC835_001594 [Tilletia horrida]|nr:hypothetical protein OC835_001594 [Tilletia horrida]